ncbi:MAG: bifunctional oligoribonuclease/PAP phosphatase NrnA [Bdellovibrionales bacterium]
MISQVRFNNLNVSSIVKKILSASSILLSTHKQCDGDGLGAMLGLYHALKKLGKTVRVVAVDEIPKKYKFLDHEFHLEIYNDLKTPIESTDLAMIFDTNDRRLVEPLFSKLEEKCKDIIFIDHHPILHKGPEPTPGSFIDTSAASTGEIAYFIIKSLNIRFDEKIARALYTSLAFDTQIFKYVKNSGNTHLICAELLEHERQADKIHRALFANFTRKKVTYLGKVLSEVEYLANDRIAILNLSRKDLEAYELDMDDSRDVIDMIMSIESVVCAAILREDAPNLYKISLRSKGPIEVLGIAENFGGGGHMFASGAECTGNYNEIHDNLVNQILSRLDSK